MINVQRGAFTGSYVPMDSMLKTKDSSSWDFFDVESSDINATYFDDSFTYVAPEYEAKSMPKSTKALVGCFLGLILCAGGFLGYQRVTDDKLYEKYNNIATIYDTQMQIEYKNGIAASQDKIVQFDTIMNTYFNAFHNTADIQSISNVCMNSQITQNYINTRKSIETVYDQNDGYIRIYDKFFSTFKYEIDRVIYDEESKIYYCYTKVTIPSTLDIQAYIQQNSYLITKFFNNYDINSANIINCIDNNIFASSTIVPSVSTICLEATENENGTLMLLDDSTIYNSYNEAYTQLLTGVLSIVKNGTVVSE